MDSTTDNSLRTLWGIVKTAGTPDYVAEGTIVDREMASTLPDTAFADCAHRRFPITDRANTWVSAGYFAKTAGDCGYSAPTRRAVRDRIKRAAAVYGISADVENVMAKMSAPPPAEKCAADDLSNYCDPDHRGYPVFDKQGAELANDYFSRNAYKYGHERRMAIARNIMKKSAEYGVKPSEQVRVSAGDGFPNREVLAEHLAFRAKELMRRGTYKMAEELCKFASEICSCSDEDLFRCRDGIFDALGNIDEVSGLDELYDKKFSAPEELVFDIPLSSMREVMDDAVPLGGDIFSAKALSMLPKGLFESVLPRSMVEGMMDGGRIAPKKLSVTIISLKSPEASHLKRAIKDYSDGLTDVEDEEEEGGEGAVEVGGDGKTGMEIEVSGSKDGIEIETSGGKDGKGDKSDKDGEDEKDGKDDKED